MEKKSPQKLTSIFGQKSKFYTGHVHSILGKNLNVACRRRFSQFFSPYYTLRKFLILAENRGQFFLDFFS